MHAVKISISVAKENDLSTHDFIPIKDISERTLIAVFVRKAQYLKSIIVTMGAVSTSGSTSKQHKAAVMDLFCFLVSEWAKELSFTLRVWQSRTITRTATDEDWQLEDEACCNPIGICKVAEPFTFNLFESIDQADQWTTFVTFWACVGGGHS